MFSHLYNVFHDGEFVVGFDLAPELRRFMNDIEAEANNPNEWQVLMDVKRGSVLVNVLEWLAQHENYELSYEYPEWEDIGEWQVHAVNGGVNDREWTLIGSGETPLAALEDAYNNES